jgi:uncharacterized protein (TIGR03435 family)
MPSMRTLLLLAFASACWCQQPEFEIASIKPNHSPTGGSNFNRKPGGGLDAIHVTLKDMILFAYDLREYQLIGGPKWLDEERYDVIAKPNHDDVVETNNYEEAWRKIHLKMRSLLADRFKLAIHNETRELPIYALILGKNGPHLTPSTAEGLNIHNQTGHLVCTKITMKQFAEMPLSARMGRSVVDKTGLTGEFDFDVTYLPDRAATSTDASGPDFLTAMQEQLGLKLEPRKGPVPVIVVDRAEKATEN